MRKWQADSIAVIAIIVTVFVFFSRLFWPVPKLIVTPDFGRSDAWHSSFSAKFFLSESLARGNLPLWNPYIGGGYPMHAEGLVGSLFLPNLILFRFFNVVTAYNVALVFYVALFGIGVYIWMRTLALHPIPALFAGTTAVFSGIIIGHLTHMMILPGLVLMPWVMVAAIRLGERVTTNRIALVAVLFAQQHFAGFPQATFLTACFAGLWLLFLAWQKRRIAPVIGIASAFVLSLPLAAAQLIPSYEFLNNSTAQGGFNPTIASYFSFPYKHLLTFIAPYALGNPKLGTYPDFTTLAGSIFWENSGYIGIVALMFAGAAFFLKRTKQQQSTRFFALSLALAFLLMTGRYSPFYFIFAAWPFNLFRVPSRFIWIFTLSLIALSAHTVQRLWESNRRRTIARCIVILALILTIVDLTRTWYDYHLLAPAEAWLSVPRITQSILPDLRFITVGSEDVHNATFLAAGWQQADIYAFLRQAVSPNSNVIWHLSNHDVYAGRYLKRPSVLDGLIAKGISIEDTEAMVSALAAKLLRLSSVGSIVTPLTINAPGYSKAASYPTNGHILSVYANPNAVPRISLVRRVFYVKTVEEAISKLREDAFQPGITALVESPLTIEESNGNTGTAQLTSKTDQTLTITVRNPGPPELLVVSDTYYPGWEGTIDGIPTGILPVNVRQRGIVVPMGNHEIRFFFRPWSVRIGVWITIATHLCIVIVIAAAFFQDRKAVRIHQRARGHGLRL